MQKGNNMEIYEKVSTNLNFVEREKATRSFWEQKKIFEKMKGNQEKFINEMKKMHEKELNEELLDIFNRLQKEQETILNESDEKKRRMR